MSQSLQKIVSGGQTGVDQAALDVAISLQIPHGGWCPKGRLSESGPIPDIYQLTEHESYEYAKRTEQNVIDSDGTLILFWNTLSRGTKLTSRLAKKHRRPHLAVDLSDEPSPLLVQAWVSRENIGVLNIAGPRASSHESIGRHAEAFLIRALEEIS